MSNHTSDAERSALIGRAEKLVKEQMAKYVSFHHADADSRYDPSHDWAHGEPFSPTPHVSGYSLLALNLLGRALIVQVDRVRHTAMKIATTLEGVDLLVIELAALFHDLADGKSGETL
jgi:hypothetical protein